DCRHTDVQRAVAGLLRTERARRSQHVPLAQSPPCWQGAPSNRLLETSVQGRRASLARRHRLPGPHTELPTLHSAPPTLPARPDAQNACSERLDTGTHETCGCCVPQLASLWHGEGSRSNVCA